MLPRILLVSKQRCGHVYASLTQRIFRAGHFTGKIDLCEGDGGVPLISCVNGKGHAVFWESALFRGCVLSLYASKA